MQDDLKGTSLSKCEEALSKILGASKDTVHGWRIEKNGPIDLDKIKELATALGLKNYMDLLYTNEHKEDITPMEITVTERQLDSLKKIYDAFLLFFDEYERTEGFNDYYLHMAPCFGRFCGAKRPRCVASGQYSFFI
jgi:hypothetical protein